MTYTRWLREKEAAMAIQLENEYRDNLLLPAKTIPCEAM
jgi:hypothetical protein